MKKSGWRAVALTLLTDFLIWSGKFPSFTVGYREVFPFGFSISIFNFRFSIVSLGLVVCASGSTGC